MRRRDPHLFDEQYDGVLSAMALCGGVATVDQLAAWLGGLTAARALVAIAIERRMGSGIALPGGPALALRRTTMRLLTGRETARPVLDVARFTAVHRFEYHLREGRPLYPTRWIDPALFARGRVRHAEAALAMWRSLGRLASVFVDLDPAGSRMVVVDRGFAARQYRRLLDALGIVGSLVGQPIELRVVCGSPLHGQRVRRLLDDPGGPTPGVVWDVRTYDTARFFADGFGDEVHEDAPTTPVLRIAPSESAEAAETQPG